MALSKKKIITSVSLVVVAAVAIPTALSLLNGGNRVMSEKDREFKAVLSSLPDSLKIDKRELSDNYKKFYRSVLDSLPPEELNKYEQENDLSWLNDNSTIDSVSSLFNLRDLISRGHTSIPLSFYDSVMDEAEDNADKAIERVSNVYKMLTNSKFSSTWGAVKKVLDKHPDLSKKITKKETDSVVKIIGAVAANPAGFDTFLDKVKANAEVAEKGEKYCEVKNMIIAIIIGKEAADKIATSSGNLKTNLQNVKTQIQGKGLSEGQINQISNNLDGLSSVKGLADSCKTS